MLTFLNKPSKSTALLRIFVISQHPLVIESFEFEPSGNAARFTQINRIILGFPKECNHNENLGNIDELIQYSLLQGSSVEITIANPSSMPPSGIVKLRASNQYYNQYYKDVALEYDLI